MQAFGAVGGYQYTAVQFHLQGITAIGIPGFVGAKKQVELLAVALHIQHIGEVGHHLGIIPMNRHIRILGLGIVHGLSTGRVGVLVAGFSAGE